MQPRSRGRVLAICQAVTSRIPERLQSINKGLNTLHFYQMTFNPNRPGELAGGAQDNGSWMSLPGTKTWVETFVADGAYNGFDASDPNYSSLVVAGRLAGRALDQPRNQEAAFWIADTLLTTGAAPFRYDREAAAFIAPTLFHPKVSKLMFTSREHVFRSLNGGVNPNFPYAKVKEHCNLWTGNGDIDENGVYQPAIDVCDDWKPMGNPGHPGRLTYGPAAACPTAANPTGAWTVAVPGAVSVGRRSLRRSRLDQRAVAVGQERRLGGHQRRTHLRHDERPRGRPGLDPVEPDRPELDGRSAAVPDATSTSTRRTRTTRYITYSGYNHVTPATPGHVFEVRFNPATGTATFTSLDGTGPQALGDLPVGTIERDEKKGVALHRHGLRPRQAGASENGLDSSRCRGSRRPRSRT